MDKYNLLLDAVGYTLKEAGYNKAGNAFFLRKDNNWGVLDFQKSRESIKDEIIFTINLGVVSTTLRKLVDFDNSSKKPNLGAYHWRVRIGGLMNAGDFWWRIDDSEEIDNIIIDVVQALNNFAIPMIEKSISDEGLINEFEKGGAGNTEIRRYILLTTLLKVNKDIRLESYIDKMLEYSSGKPSWSKAHDHIRHLNTF